MTLSKFNFRVASHRLYFWRDNRWMIDGPLNLEHLTFSMPRNGI